MKFFDEAAVDYAIHELKHEDWIAANAFSRPLETGLSVVEAGSIETAPERNHHSGYELITLLDVNDWFTAGALSHPDEQRGLTVVDAGGRSSEIVSRHGPQFGGKRHVAAA